MQRISLPIAGGLLFVVILLPLACTAGAAMVSGSLTAAWSKCWQPTPTPSHGPNVSEPSDSPSAGVSQGTRCQEVFPYGTGRPVGRGIVSAPDARAATAVAAAVVAVGREGRYVPEGNGPVDFDCSGLTAYAWRAAGVNLADYSYTQWDQTQRIMREALAPGDLVFWFGGDVHHVAIVVDVDGHRVQIAEAANPTDGIRIRDFGNSWDQQYVSGYGRVIHG